LYEASAETGDYDFVVAEADDGELGVDSATLPSAGGYLDVDGVEVEPENAYEDISDAAPVVGETSFNLGIEYSDGESVGIEVDKIACTMDEITEQVDFDSDDETPLSGPAGNDITA
jgi:hypothetical protein